MNELKELLKERLVSEDDHRRAQEEIQKLTDRHVHDIDAVLADKEKELLQV
jgi:ribosome recycling factor